jgi:hypothetical protein
VKSNTYSAEVENEWDCASTPPIRLNGMDREKFLGFFFRNASRNVQPIWLNRAGSF